MLKQLAVSFCGAVRSMFWAVAGCLLPPDSLHPKLPPRINNKGSSKLDRCSFPAPSRWSDPLRYTHLTLIQAKPTDIHCQSRRNFPQHNKTIHNMPSYALLSAAASVALAGLTAARPIPYVPLCRLLGRQALILSVMQPHCHPVQTSHP